MNDRKNVLNSTASLEKLESNNGYNNILPVPEEYEDMVCLHVTAAMKASLQAVAARRGTTISSIIRDCLIISVGERYPEYNEYYNLYIEKIGNVSKPRKKRGRPRKSQETDK